MSDLAPEPPPDRPSFTEAMDAAVRLARQAESFGGQAEKRQAAAMASLAWSAIALAIPPDRTEGSGQKITCPRCGMTSHNPNDVWHGYCGQCHEYTSPSMQARMASSTSA